METTCATQWDEWIKKQPKEDLERFVNSVLQKSMGLNLPTATRDIPLRPAIFSSSLVSDLAKISRRIMDISEQTLNMILRQEIDFVKYFGYEEDVKKFMSHRKLARNTIQDIGRPDILLHQGKAKVLEINAHTAIGGMPECDLMIHSYFQQKNTADLFSRHHLTASSPLTAMARYLLEKAQDIGIQGRPPCVALIEWEYDVEMNYLYSSALSRLGIPTVFAHPDLVEEKQGSLYYGEQKIDIALRNVSLDAWNPSDDFPFISQYLKACAQGGTLIISDERASLMSNKAFFAEMYKNLSAYSPQDAKFIREFLPWSSFIGDGIVDFHGQKISMHDLLDPRHREKFVLKKGRGEGGEGVYVGRTTSAAEWTELIAKSWNNPHYFIQEFFAPDTLTLPYLNEDGVSFQQTAFVLGQYTVGKEIISPLVRLDKADRRGVINHAQGAIVSTSLVEVL
jgi:hypothetical protein